jgi:hypothetical protein
VTSPPGMSLDAGSQGTSLSRNDIHVLLFWGDFFAAAAVEKSTFLRKGKGRCDVTHL